MGLGLKVFVLVVASVEQVGKSWASISHGEDVRPEVLYLTLLALCGCFYLSKRKTVVRTLQQVLPVVRMPDKVAQDLSQDKVLVLSLLTI